MFPKFKIGEQAILKSESEPDKNGDVVVLSRSYGDCLASDGTVYKGFAYICDVMPTVGRGWNESALRKKHQPGEMSFSSLMASLSPPKLITQDKT